MTEKPQLLSLQNKAMIKKVWKNLNPLDKVSSSSHEFLSRVWIKAINRSPTMKKEIFGMHLDSSEQEIRGNHRFNFIVSHAHTFFEELINKHGVDSEKGLLSMVELGEKHGKIKSAVFQVCSHPFGSAH